MEIIMKKRFFAEMGFVFIFIFSSCLVNLAVMEIAVKIVDLFVVVDYFTAVIVRLVVSAVTVSGMVGAINYLLSYKRAEFEIGVYSGSFWLATLVQLLLSVLFKFHPFIGGGSFYLAGLLEHGSSFDSSSAVEYIGIIDYLIAFVIFALFDYAVCAVLGILGARKRKADREALVSETQTEK